MSEWIKNDFEQSKYDEAVARLVRVLEAENRKIPRRRAEERAIKRNKIKIAVATLLLALVSKAEFEFLRKGWDDSIINPTERVEVDQRSHQLDQLDLTDSRPDPGGDEDGGRDIAVLSTPTPPEIARLPIDEREGSTPEIVDAQLSDPTPTSALATAITENPTLTLTPIPAATATERPSSQQESPTPAPTEIISQHLFSFSLENTRDENTNVVTSLKKAFDNNQDILKILLDMYPDAISTTVKVRIVDTTTTPSSYLMSFEYTDDLRAVVTADLPERFDGSKPSNTAHNWLENGGVDVRVKLRQYFRNQDEELVFRTRLNLLSLFFMLGSLEDYDEISASVVDPNTSLDRGDERLLSDPVLNGATSAADQFAIDIIRLERGVELDKIPQAVLTLIDWKWRWMMNERALKNLDELLQIGIGG